MRQVRRRSAEASHAAIFAAAAEEFSERGFEAGGVDRIAAKARVNKAMLYYHFGSKRALYIEVLRDMFRAVGARVRAIADGPGTAAEKLETWVATIIEEAAARPWFPPIMLRELASGAPRFDPETFAHDERRLRRRARHHRAGAARRHVRRRRSAAHAPHHHAAHPHVLRAPARAGRQGRHRSACSSRASSTPSCAHMQRTALRLVHKEGPHLP